MRETLLRSSKCPWRSPSPRWCWRSSTASGPAARRAPASPPSTPRPCAARWSPPRPSAAPSQLGPRGARPVSTRRRNGFRLMEALVAGAIAAGPMLFAIHLVQQNAAGARFSRGRAVERLILLDLAEILVAEPVAELRTL